MDQQHQWSQTAKHELIQIDGLKAICTEYEEGGIALLDRTCLENDSVTFVASGDVSQTHIGFGIFDAQILDQHEYSAQAKFGLNHGMWMLTNDKIIASSNDETLDKKTKGFEIFQGAEIKCVKNGLDFMIEGGVNEIHFKLDPDRQYCFGAYLSGGWNANEGAECPAQIHIKN